MLDLKDKALTETNKVLENAFANFAKEKLKHEDIKEFGLPDNKEFKPEDVQLWISVNNDVSLELIFWVSKDSELFNRVHRGFNVPNGAAVSPQVSWEQILGVRIDLNVLRKIGTFSFLKNTIKKYANKLNTTPSKIQLQILNVVHQGKNVNIPFVYKVEENTEENQAIKPWHKNATLVHQLTWTGDVFTDESHNELIQELSNLQET